MFQNQEATTAIPPGLRGLRSLKPKNRQKEVPVAMNMLYL